MLPQSTDEDPVVRRAEVGAELVHGLIQFDLGALGGAGTQKLTGHIHHTRKFALANGRDIDAHLNAHQRQLAVLHDDHPHAVAQGE